MRYVGLQAPWCDARDGYILRKAGAHRAQKVISVCGEDGTNVEVAEQMRAIARKRNGKDLDCLIHIKDSYLWTLLREQQFSVENSGVFRLDLFNVYDSGARILLRDVFRGGKVSLDFLPCFLVIGLGGLGEHLIIRAAQEWGARFTQTGRKLPISVIDPCAEEKLACLKMRFPLVNDVCKLTPLNFNTYHSDFHQADFLDKTVSYVYICLDNASIGLQAALTLLQFMQQRRTPAIPIMIRMTEDAGLAKFLQEVKSTGNAFTNLTAFGLLDRTCKVGSFDDGTHEALARVIHDYYVESEKEKGYTVAENPSLVSWDGLPEKYRQANRHQADHIGAKLNAIGCGITPWRTYEAKEFCFSHDDIEFMAIMEHKRWCEEKASQDWRYGPERNNTQKIHPDLLRWEDPNLSEETRQKNRQEVRLIPVLLSRAGFQIYRVRGN